MGSGRGGSSNDNNNNKTYKNNGAGAGAGAAAVGLQSIPAGSRKVVQSLKEIVNCPEPEIYAMLKECNMDPNEAVNRLLSQDPFREVKSKREKKKEQSKDIPESRSRGSTATSNRGRGGTDRYAAHGGSTQHSSSESGVFHGRPGYKKENAAAYASPTSGVGGNSASRQPPPQSDAAASEFKMPAAGMIDNMSSTSQPSGYQAAWGGAPGQVSMADIVKMGRPQSKMSSTPSLSHNVNHQHTQGPLSASHKNFHYSEDHTSKVFGENLVSGVHSAQHVSIEDDWPSIEQPLATSIPSISRPPVVPDLHPESFNLAFDTANRHSGLDEVQATEDGTVDDHDANHVGPSSVSGRKLLDDNSEGSSLFENDMYINRGPYQPQSRTFDLQGENASASVSSVTANLQTLNVQKEDAALPLEREGPSVVIPDHLQVQSADCSHLSFGTFGSSFNAAFSGSLSSMPMKANLAEAPLEADGSLGHSDTRNSDYYGGEPLINASKGTLYHRAGATTGSYDSSAAQSEPLKVENLDVEHGNQYAFPPATTGYTYENSQQLNIGFSESQTSSHIQNLSPFSNVMPAYTNPLPNSLLAANVPPGRESDLPYLPFPVAQTMAAKYSNIVSSIGGSSISMDEAIKTGGFSSTQRTSQTTPGNSVATAPALPTHLAAHPYSQPTLPLGPYTNMIGYPFLPQNYAYLPSAFQQAFPGSSSYHQSLAAVLPQYKNSVSVSSLPQSAAIAFGYGSSGNSTTIAGNFQMNPAAAPSGTNLGYDDVLSAQYKDSNHLISLQQSDNSGMWLHGPGSRTISGLPASTYYSFQGQGQQPGGFRQGQQPSQNYGAALGYPNFYQSQTGMSLDHPQQNPRDVLIGGSQGQPKQSQQIWQNNY